MLRLAGVYYIHYIIDAQKVYMIFVKSHHESQPFCENNIVESYNSCIFVNFQQKKLEMSRDLRYNYVVKIF